jgi:hypothetical protein
MTATTREYISPTFPSSLKKGTTTEIRGLSIEPIHCSGFCLPPVARTQSRNGFDGQKPFPTIPPACASAGQDFTDMRAVVNTTCLRDPLLNPARIYDILPRLYGWLL